MAYLALYRRFRPTTLDDVVRQEHIVTVLKNQIETGRVGHAYLFCGPRGTGKTSIAKIFAAAINCESPVGGSACGKCAVCRALSDPSNLDISEIDAASNNGVDEMRDLREKVQYPPVAGKYKVYIVDEVHMLSPGAFNALLKTLEEPPSHAVFILATTEAHKIPATILSRCMRFDFKLIPQSDLEERLKKILREIGKEYEEEAVAAIARAGAGSVRDMLSLADTCVSYSTGKLTGRDVTEVLGGADFLKMSELCGAILRGDAGAAISLTEAFAAEGKNVGILLRDAMSFFNACTVAKTCRDAEKLLALPPESFAAATEIARATDGHRLLRTMEIFSRTESELKYTVSPRILFETAVFKASMPEVDYDIESLLARVAELEKRIKESGGNVRLNSAPEVREEKNFVAVATEAGKNPIADGGTDGAQDGYYAPDDGYVPPDEPPPETDGGIYFDSGFAAEAAPSRGAPARASTRQAGAASEKAAESADRQKKEETSEFVGKKSSPSVRGGGGEVAFSPSVSAPPVVNVRPATPGDAKATFGSFLRALRKVGRNGVLFTICMDLDSGYENGKFVLYTESETIARSLAKEEHRALLTQAFAAIGISADGFDVRLRAKKGDEFNKNLGELKERFSGVDIEVK